MTKILKKIRRWSRIRSQILFIFKIDDFSFFNVALAPFFVYKKGEEKILKGVN